MTIDKAIEMLEANNKCNACLNHLECEPEHCSIYKKLGTMDDIMQVEASLLKWLKELKFLKEQSLFDGFTRGYDKALDDVIESINNKKCTEAIQKLKKADKTLTCFDCKHHSMSDMYLECWADNGTILHSCEACDKFERIENE